MQDGLKSGEFRADTLSGLNVYAAGSGVLARVSNANGAIFSQIRGSGTTGTYGAKIQFGSCITTSAGFGSAIFQEAFFNSFPPIFVAIMNCKNIRFKEVNFV